MRYAGILFLLLGAALYAQPQEHHRYLHMEREALEKGEGFGMAMAADRNGYPGPKHILDLKDQLKLTTEQVRAATALFDDMRARAIPAGRAVLAAEEELARLFASGKAAEAEVAAKVKQIAALRAGLRMAHLRAHLAARSLLTPEQLAAYSRRRGESH